MARVSEFYDGMADFYHLLFQDWDASIQRQAAILDCIFQQSNLAKQDVILDCACGIGTQSLGLASLGYKITGSDISEGEIARAKIEAAKRELDIAFFVADFCELSAVFKNSLFDAIIAMDNALPHLLEPEQLARAAASISAQLKPGGTFLASIRDYDAILQEKPLSPAPYILKTPNGKRIAFQIWDWSDRIYNFTQYIIEDAQALTVYKFSSTYNAITRCELTEIFSEAGFRNIHWLMPEQSGFYQPIIIAKK
ncbi:Ubiquinone biosynthesis O-methyltransferase [bioreactor metagenome]|uniref:Ubiquinone biosynthesis O-methyltransferase n=1 Tax=bioreactor metagenome TaxID=1076179 RepID=A0A644XQ46_9ZZZZ